MLGYYAKDPRYDILITHKFNSIQIQKHSSIDDKMKRQYFQPIFEIFIPNNTDFNQFFDAAIN